MKLLKIILSLIFSATFFFSCDDGIAPRPITIDPGFRGTITFMGEWPDSVQRTHIVMFKNPLNQPGDFHISNIRYIGSEIPYGAQSFEYTSEDNYLEGKFEPGEYAYLAVAQSKTSILSLNRDDWYIIGVYTNNQEQNPITLTLRSGTIISDINIMCDFNNPPPQPPSVN